MKTGCFGRWMGVGWALGWCLGVGVNSGWRIWIQNPGMGWSEGFRCYLWGPNEVLLTLWDDPNSLGQRIRRKHGIIICIMTLQRKIIGHIIYVLLVSGLVCQWQFSSYVHDFTPIANVGVIVPCINIYKLSMRSKNWFKVPTNSNHQTIKPWWLWNWETWDIHVEQLISWRPKITMAIKPWHLDESVPGSVMISWSNNVDFTMRTK